MYLLYFMDIIFSIYIPYKNIKINKTKFLRNNYLKNYNIPH